MLIHSVEFKLEDAHILGARDLSSPLFPYTLPSVLNAPLPDDVKRRDGSGG